MTPCTQLQGHNCSKFNVFTLPCLDTMDYRLPVAVRDIRDVKDEFTTSPPANGCSVDTEEILNNLMAAHDKDMPSSATESIQLFKWMCDKLE